MKRGTIYNLIKSHYEGNDNDFFWNTLEVLKEFKEDCPELYEQMVWDLKGKIKIRPKREEPMYKSDMKISFEKAEELGLNGPYLVPQEDSYMQILQRRLDRGECPIPLKIAYPRSNRRAHIEGDEIVIEFVIEFIDFTCSNEIKSPFEVYRFKLADQGKTWDFIGPTAQPEID